MLVERPVRMLERAKHALCGETCCVHSKREPLEPSKLGRVAHAIEGREAIVFGAGRHSGRIDRARRRGQPRGTHLSIRSVEPILECSVC